MLDKKCVVIKEIYHIPKVNYNEKQGRLSNHLKQSSKRHNQFHSLLNSIKKRDPLVFKKAIKLSHTVEL
jgi:hypothetical protein